MSYYVHRIHDDGRNGWVGPIRSNTQADKEATAWKDCGWMAWVHESDTQVKLQVRAWEKQVKAKRAQS